MTNPNPTLSPRQDQVLKALASGLSVKEIAFDLGISPKTAAGHLSKVYDVLGFHNPILLAHYALKRGLVELKT